MNKLYRTLNWIFGVLATLIGLSFLTISVIGGLIFMLIGLVLLPPARDYIFNKYKASITSTTRGFLIFVFFIISIGFISHDSTSSAEEKYKEQEKLAVEKIIQKKKDNIEYFTKNKSTIIEQLNALLIDNDFKGVVDGASKYLATNDPDLQAVHNKAKEQVLFSDLINAKLEKNNLKKLQSIYQQLSFVNPTSTYYKENAEYYAEQAKAEEAETQVAAAKQQIAENRNKELKPQFNSWDGSHRGLERHIKTIMNDPASYEHDETSYIDRGEYLIIITQFRGKNAFGGVVRNTIKAKVDLSGNVLEIIE